MNGKNFTGYYRTQSGCFYFSWRFVRLQNSEVIAYILEAPSYVNRPADGHSTHRYYDESRQLYYICYEPMPTTYGDMVAVAKEWAELTERYIHYGERF
jgi:hypothetical protein